MSARHAAAHETPVERLVRFEAEIAANDDLTFGIELYSQLLALARGDDPDGVEEIRQLYTPVIATARQASRDAASLLAAARNDHARIEAVEKVRFTPCPGHPHPDALQLRARLLLKHYHRLFKERPRTQLLTKAELLDLIDAAAQDPAFTLEG